MLHLLVIQMCISRHCNMHECTAAAKAVVWSYRAVNVLGMSLFIGAEYA